MSILSLEDQIEMRELIGLLIDLEAPHASESDRERMTHDWLSVGYEEIVRSWTYCHGKIRREEAA